MEIIERIYRVRKVRSYSRIGRDCFINDCVHIVQSGQVVVRNVSGLNGEWKHLSGKD